VCCREYISFGGERRMGSLQNAKILGGIGALLVLIGFFITSSFGILSLIGFILTFIAVKMIADEAKEKDIFNNFLYFFIFSIVAIIAAGVIIVITFASAGGFEFIMDLQNMALSNPTDPMIIWDTIAPAVAGFLAAVLIGWIILIISVFFLRKSFTKISEVTKVKWFGTTALLYLIGAFTMIILIGFLIIIIAMILEIVAFFSLPDQLPAKAE
jgi:uncharacterized membrane protein